MVLDLLNGGWCCGGGWCSYVSGMTVAMLGKLHSVSGM